jgi:hypothetical protein
MVDAAVAEVLVGEPAEAMADRDVTLREPVEACHTGDATQAEDEL